MSIITLLTDFGLKDGNVGVMKGVILRIAPQAQIVDLSHLISPQNLFEAGLVLYRSAPYFPPGTIHLFVVDPGVGTERRPIAALIGDQFFVGPDNGILTMLLENAERTQQEVKAVHLDRPEYWLPQVSYVFHGRDIFAPVAAHLAAGMQLAGLGKPVENLIRLELPLPEHQGATIHGQVIHIDHFGNISSNLRLEHLEGETQFVTHIRGVDIHGPAKTFGDRAPGELITLFGSTGNLIICVVNGSAAQKLGAKVGDPLTVTLAGQSD